MSILPEGTYKAHAVRVDMGDGDKRAVHFSVTKNGYDQLAVRFMVCEGEHAGQEITWFGSMIEEISGKAKSPPIVNTLKGVRALGFTGKNIYGCNSQPLDNVVNIVISHNEWEGKVQAKVAWVNDPNDAPMMKLTLADDQRARLLSAKCEKYLADSSPVNGAKAPATDLPF